MSSVTPAEHHPPRPRRPAALGRERVLAILRRHERELRERFAVRSLALFGSVVRGQARRGSDVDLLVEFERPVGLLHLSGTAVFIEEQLRRPVDLVLRRAVLPELRERIFAEAVDVF